MGFSSCSFRTPEHGHSSCGTWALLTQVMWHLLRPGIEPVSLHWQPDPCPPCHQGSPRFTFCTWTSRCSRTVFWKCRVCALVLSTLPCEDWLTVFLWVNHGALYFFSSPVVHYFSNTTLLLLFCNHTPDYHSFLVSRGQVALLSQLCSSMLGWLFRVFCLSIQTFESVWQDLHNNLLGFWLSLHWIYRSR